MHTQVPFSLMARMLARVAGLGGGEPDAVRQQALRTWLSRHLAGEEVERAALALGELVSATPREALLELERARELCDRIEASWCAWLRAECEAGPVLLVLEDLHWADAATVQLLRRTIERSGALGMDHVGAVARHNLGRRIGEAGRVHEGLALEQAALASFERHGNLRMMGLTRCHMAWILLQAGRFDEAMPHVELALAELEGQPAGRVIALATRAQILLRSDEVERALADARVAIEGLEALGRVQEGESFVRLTWAEALAAAGQGREARDAILTAHRRLVERAELIEDLELRASFLGKVSENASIVAYAEAWCDR